ncbi:hypothetical protein QVD17_18419 [Tagetes erecta]|uniref:Auxin efflux carrier component n=1 Tax=Tagetes erecta TaxID=13708 RepID=A0AAD8NWA7_TARER|nr:hypothetical protein QVD17_18419 [Tagetes erecta]
MITGSDFYAIVTAMVPLYVAMFLAYGSVKWWKIFTPDQCSGINRFVAIFAVPLLSFHFISTSNPYTMNLRFIAADSVQKLIILTVLGIWTKFSKTGSFEWMITIFSLATLPNSLVIGIPLLKAMYGEFCANLMVQVVVMQCIVWYTLLLFMFEFRAAKVLIRERFPGSGGEIVAFNVESDVVSLDVQDQLETIADVGDDGKLHVTVRKSNASRRSLGFGSLSGVEIYSLSSSAVQTPRGSYVNQSDFNFVLGFPGGRLSSFGPADDLYSIQSSKVVTPRQSNFGDEAVSTVVPEMYPGVMSLRPKGIYDDVFGRSSSCPVVAKGGRPRNKLYATTERSDRPEKKGEKETKILISDRQPKSKPGELKDFEIEVGGDREKIKPGVKSAEPIPEIVSNEQSGDQLPSVAFGNAKNNRKFNLVDLKYWSWNGHV